jgi:hypothetical protein
MDLKQLVRYVVSIATRQSVAGFYIHAPVAVLLLSAEVLSIMAAGHPAAGAETMPNTCLAMMY